MPDGVVVLQQLPVLTQRGVQIVRGGGRPECHAVALVLHLDEEDVVDLPGRQGGPTTLEADCSADVPALAAVAPKKIAAQARDRTNGRRRR